MTDRYLLSTLKYVEWSAVCLLHKGDVLYTLINMSIVHVNGTLEYVQQVVQQCRDEYESIKASKPVGMLDRMLETFGLEKNPVYLSGKKGYTSSSSDIGALVHKQLEDAARGQVVVQPHSFTVAIGDFLRARQWYVIAAEVPLVVPHLKMFTRIDLMLFDLRANEVILAELKTGYDTGYRARLVSQRAHLGLPPKDVFDSHHARTHLQLAWMYWAFNSKFAVPKLRSIVLLVNSRGVRVEKMAQWAKRNTKVIHDRVCAKRATQLEPQSISTARTHN